MLRMSENTYDSINLRKLKYCRAALCFFMKLSKLYVFLRTNDRFNFKLSRRVFKISVLKASFYKVQRTNAVSFELVVKY